MLTMMEERPTTAERYSTAMDSSNLKIDPDHHRDIDLIIASAWAGSGIGSLLMRLRNEYDANRSRVTGQGDNLITDHLLALMDTVSLKPARQALGDLGIKQAALTHFNVPDADVFKLVGRVIDVFLDPLCRACDGKGYTGGGRHEQSGPPMRCKHCRETGKRRVQLGRNDDERGFSMRMLSLMEDAMSAHETDIRARMR